MVASLGDARCANKTKGFVPCYTNVTNNTYCNTSSFVGNLPQKVLAFWHAAVQNNTKTC